MVWQKALHLLHFNQVLESINVWHPTLDRALLNLTMVLKTMKIGLTMTILTRAVILILNPDIFLNTFLIRITEDYLFHLMKSSHMKNKRLESLAQRSLLKNHQLMVQFQILMRINIMSYSSFLKKAIVKTTRTPLPTKKYSLSMT